MFRYKPKGKPSFEITNPQITSIPMSFWDRIAMTSKSEWPQIVRDYKLTPEQMIAAAERIKIVEERMENAGVDLRFSAFNPYKFV